MAKITKRHSRLLRKARVRKVVSGSEARPRLAVFRSATHIYAQLIDDKSGRTLVAASSKELKDKAGKTDKCLAVGKLIAGKAKDKGITCVDLDRGGNGYQGRVKALADGAREGGLEF